jgi:hypothetical protein
MGSEPIEPKQVLARIDSDPRLASQRDRCWVYHETFRWSKDEYAKETGEKCAQYPFDAFPWQE